MGHAFSILGTGIVFLGMPLIAILASIQLAFERHAIGLVFFVSALLLFIGAVGSVFLEYGKAWKKGEPTPDFKTVFRVGAFPFRVLTGVAIWSFLIILLFLMPTITHPLNFWWQTLLLAFFSEMIVNELLANNSLRK